MTLTASKHPISIGYIFEGPFRPAEVDRTPSACVGGDINFPQGPRGDTILLGIASFSLVPRGKSVGKGVRWLRFRGMSVAWQGKVGGIGPDGFF